MNLLYTLITASIMGFGLLAPANLDIDSSKDEERCKEAVVAWADSVFYQHSEYKFDNFHAFYTDEYSIQILRAQGYKDMVTDLEKDKEAGRYRGSDAEYEKEHGELKAQYEEIQKGADNFENKVTYYEIHFWSNIMTHDGITVYYEHIVKLNNDYQVTDAVINSAIGKKDENTKILYASEVNGGKEKGKPKVDEKTEDADIEKNEDSDNSSKGKKKGKKKSKDKATSKGVPSPAPDHNSNRGN